MSERDWESFFKPADFDGWTESLGASGFIAIAANKLIREALTQAPQIDGQSFVSGGDIYWDDKYPRTHSGRIVAIREVEDR